MKTKKYAIVPIFMLITQLSTVSTFASVDMSKITLPQISVHETVDMETYNAQNDDYTQEDPAPTEQPSENKVVFDAMTAQGVNGVNESGIYIPEPISLPEGQPANQTQDPINFMEPKQQQSDPTQLGIDLPEEKVNPGIDIDAYRWNLKEGKTTISLDVSKSVTRFELFYSSTAPRPDVIFMDPSGNRYVVGMDNNNETIMTSMPLQFAGHSDMRYVVIYIVAPPETKNWTAQIAVDSGTHEMIFVKTDIPADWSEITEEYRMPPTELLLWGLKNSEYTDVDLFAMVEDVDIRPESNNLGVAPAPKEEPKDYTTLIIGIGAVLIAGIGGLMYYNHHQQKKMQQEKIDNRIKRRNTNLKKRKSQEDMHLDRYLKNEDYSDDAYFKENPTELSDDFVAPIDKHEAFVEVEDEDTRKQQSARPNPVPEEPNSMTEEEEEVEIPAWLLS